MSETANSRLEKKVDALIGDMASIKAILIEREKSETLRDDVIRQAMKTQDKAIDSVSCRVAKLEDSQSKVVWLIISLVIIAVVGTVLVTNIAK